MQVDASDLNTLPNGTAASVDVDTNNDGNFTDSGETNYATGTLTNGFVTLKLPKLAGTGTYPMRARIHRPGRQPGGRVHCSKRLR